MGCTIFEEATEPAKSDLVPQGISLVSSPLHIGVLRPLTRALNDCVLLFVMSISSPIFTHVNPPPSFGQNLHRHVRLVQSVVKMVPECRNILNAIAKINLVSVSEYLYDVARLQIHKQAFYCPLAAHILNMHNKVLDQRIHKQCAGYHCNMCKHKHACSRGDTDELFVPSDQAVAMLAHSGYTAEVTYEEKVVKVPVIKITKVI